MSNKRLVGALSILLLACLFMAIGCGDGKRNTRSNTRKAFPGGKVGGTDSKTTQDKSRKLQDIDTRARSRIDGQTIDRTALQQGTYTLDEVMGYVKFMRNQDELYAFSVNQATNGALGAAVDGGNEGMMGKDSDEPRLVAIPRSFKVGAAGLEAISAQQNVIYSCQVGLDGKLSHSLNEPGAATEINLIERLMNGRTQDNLSGNKKLYISIRQTMNGARFVVEVEEMKKAAKGRKDATLYRVMVFTFKLQRSAAPADNPTTAPDGSVTPAADPNAGATPTAPPAPPDIDPGAAPTGTPEPGGPTAPPDTNGGAAAPAPAAPAAPTGDSSFNPFRNDTGG